MSSIVSSTTKDTSHIGLEPVPNTNSQNNIDTLLNLYIQAMNEKERRAYMIAKTHLGSTFDLSKSVGFTQWRSRL